MRRPLSSLLLLAVACPPSVALGADPPNWPLLTDPPVGITPDRAGDIALIVAVENYPFVPKLPGAVANAAAWERWLVARGATVKVLTDEKATRENVLEQAEQLAPLRAANGRAWLIFVGHGTPGLDHRGALVMFDTQPTTRSLESRSVSAESLALALAGDGDLVSVIDACFSGRTNTGIELAQDHTAPVREVVLPHPTGAAFLYAAGADQYAGPLPGLDRPAFSWLVLGGLRGWADTDHDGTVTVGELGDWTRRRIAELVDTRVQTPEFRGDADVKLSAGAETAPDLRALAAMSVSGSKGQSPELACAAQARAAALAAQSEALDKASEAASEGLSTLWSTVGATGRRCVGEEGRATRRACAEPVDELTRNAREAVASAPASTMTADTDCGTRVASVAAATRPVSVPWLAEADALTAQLRRPFERPAPSFNARKSAGVTLTVAGGAATLGGGALVVAMYASVAAADQGYDPDVDSEAEYSQVEAVHAAAIPLLATGYAIGGVGLAAAGLGVFFWRSPDTTIAVGPGSVEVRGSW